MSLLFLLVLQMLFHFGQTLFSCNETASKLQLCSLVSIYEKGKAAIVTDYNNVTAARIDSSITLFSLDEFNEQQSTISLNVLLALWWNDTRLSLSPKNHDVQ